MISKPCNLLKIVGNLSNISIRVSPKSWPPRLADIRTWTIALEIFFETLFFATSNSTGDILKNLLIITTTMINMTSWNSVNKNIGNLLLDRLATFRPAAIFKFDQQTIWGLHNPFSLFLYLLVLMRDKPLIGIHLPSCLYFWWAWRLIRNEETSRQVAKAYLENYPHIL